METLLITKNTDFINFVAGFLASKNIDTMGVTNLNTQETQLVFFDGKDEAKIKRGIDFIIDPNYLKPLTKVLAKEQQRYLS